jgi:protein SCO1/2
MRRLSFIALLCVIGGALGGLAAAQATRPTPRPVRFVPPRRVAFDFRLRDENGRPASLAQARGSVLVLTFMYSTCHDLCPAQASEIGDAVRKVGGGVKVDIVSVDPVGDTPATARDFLERRHLDPRVFRFLLGTRAQLRPVWAAYGIVPIGASPQEAAAAAAATERFLHSPAAAHLGNRPYSPPQRAKPPAAAQQPYPDTDDLRYRGRARHSAGVDFEHSAYVMLVDRHGIQRAGIPFDDMTSDSLAQDLRLLVAER